MMGGPALRIDGLDLDLHPDVYRPAEDSMLLARAVAAEVRRGDRFLEVGCGAGFVGLVAARAGARVWATDLNEAAVRLAAANARRNGLALTAVAGDLFAGLEGPFDVVAFNPPYLPTGPGDILPGPLNWAFDGGEDGNATVLRFAGQLGQLARRPRPRCVLVVHSSLSDPGPLAEAMGRLGYRYATALRERHAYEELAVERFSLPGP